MRQGRADRSADRAGRIVRAEREKRCLSQAALAAQACVSPATVSAVELGQRATSLDLMDQLLRAMGLRLNVEAEPEFADIDAVIDDVRGRPPAEIISEWEPDAAAYFTFFIQEDVPFMVDGLAAAALQGAPVKVDILEVVVPDGDDAILDRLAIMLYALGARRADYKPADPSLPGEPDYDTHHGRLRLRLVDQFDPVCWVDIDPLPETRLPLLWLLRPRDPLPSARVAVRPIGQVETANAQVRRVLARTRQITSDPCSQPH